jgi:hypothetical protein
VVPFLCEGEENQEESWTSVLLLFPREEFINSSGSVLLRRGKNNQEESWTSVLLLFQEKNL